MPQIIESIPSIMHPSLITFYGPSSLPGSHFCDHFVFSLFDSIRVSVTVNPIKRIDHIVQTWIGDAIVDGLTFAPSGDHTSFSQSGEMLAQCRLA